MSRVINLKDGINLKIYDLKVGDFIFFKNGRMASKKGMATNKDLSKDVDGFIFDCGDLSVYLEIKDVLYWEIDWDKTIDANYQEARRLEEEKFWAVINKAKEAIKKDKDMKFTSCQNVDCNKEYDFNDLIDVAVQAQKDKLINHLKIDNVDPCLSFEKKCGAISAWDKSCFVKGIDWIKSLYTETFVIESKEDINKIDIKTAEITYQNGFKTKIKARNPNSSTLFYNADDDGSAIKVSINELKGATVTQKRSTNE